MDLSQKQRQVVDCTSHCLVFAGPGSGKTKVLVDKATHILRSDPGRRIVVVTFTQEAASGIRRRILDRVTQREAPRIASGTFHSFALNQLKQAGINRTIIGPGQMRHYVDRAIAESRIDIPLEDAISVIETIKTTPDYEPSNDPIGKLFVAYDNLTKRNNVMDFSDMLSLTVRMMRYEGLPPKNCNDLFVDEQQDMDEMQYAWCAEHIRAGSIFTGIGDDDQSIYKFRRALGYGGMMKLQEDIGAEIIKLDINYRSNIEIVDSALSLIAANTNRMDKRILSNRGPGGSVRAFITESAENETALICEEIIKTATPVEKNGEIIYEVKTDEWAVLARNNYNLQSLSMAMDAAGIAHSAPFTSLWEKEPICTAVAMLSSLVPKRVDESESISYQKAGYDAALHYAGIDEDTLKGLHEKFGDDFAGMLIGTQDFSSYPKGTREILEKFSSQCKNWQKETRKDRANNPVNGVFNWFIDYFPQGKKGTFDPNYQRLLMAKKIMLRMEGSLQARLNRLTGQNRKRPEDKEKGKEKDNQGKVRLITIHSSKGLEFDNVWMMALDEKTIPSDTELSPLTEESLEEERRLFYVGMTRAKNRLFMSSTEFPSMFLKETGVELEHPYAQETDSSAK